MNTGQLGCLLVQGENASSQRPISNTRSSQGTGIAVPFPEVRMCTRTESLDPRHVLWFPGAMPSSLPDAVGLEDGGALSTLVLLNVICLKYKRDPPHSWCVETMTFPFARLIKESQRAFQRCTKELVSGTRVRRVLAAPPTPRHHDRWCADVRLMEMACASDIFPSVWPPRLLGLSLLAFLSEAFTQLHF